MSRQGRYEAALPDEHGNIAYTVDEDAIWRDLYHQQLPAVRKHAAAPWIAGLEQLALPRSRVPQCAEVSAVLEPLSGWRVEPVPALIDFKRFFDMLAGKRFPAASFIRRREHFDYIEEPDIFHEIFGHVPLLADPRFANLSEAIGRAGQAAQSEDHAWLIRLYWFTIEFGLTREAGELKALGSGLASSPTELPRSVLDGEVLRLPFDVVDILRTPYRIDIQQPVYFVLEQLDELFAVADRDLLADVQTARRLGLHEPRYQLAS